MEPDKQNRPFTDKLKNWWASFSRGSDVADLSSDTSLRKMGYSIFFGCLIVTFLWASWAPIDSAALAPGVVQVEGKTKKVEHLEGGIVASILVSNGDHVSAGETLIVLDATKDRAEEQILLGRLFKVTARLARLKAERDDQVTVDFSDSVRALPTKDGRAADAVAGEQQLFDVRAADKNGEIAVLNARIKQLAEQNIGLESVVASKRLVTDSLTNEIGDLTELLADGYVDKQRLRELQRAKAESVATLANLNASVAANEVTITETQLQIAQIERRFKTSVVDEIATAFETLYDLQQQLEAVSDRVRRATIKSPVQGIAMNLRVNTVGDVLRSGETLVEVVPQGEDFVVEARISPMDIDRVSLGQPAEIRFAVFKDAYLISGELVKVSADRLIDEESNIPYYSAEIRLLDDDLALLGGMPLVPGMPAEVLVKTGKTTMLGYITSPMERLFSQALIED